MEMVVVVNMRFYQNENEGNHIQYSKLFYLKLRCGIYNASIFISVNSTVREVSQFFRLQ